MKQNNDNNEVVGTPGMQFVGLRISRKMQAMRDAYTTIANHNRDTRAILKRYRNRPVKYGSKIFIRK